MKRKYRPVDPTLLKTFSIRQRAHKSETGAFAGLPQPGATAAELIRSLPRFLGAEEFRAVVDATVAAHRAGRPVVWALGAHVIKVGCSPIVVDLIERGIITAVALNGAGPIHDAEIAMIGQTSEEVADTIRTGEFGMVAETAALFGQALSRPAIAEEGLGRALGQTLLDSGAPNIGYSILAAACRAGIPLTVHVAVGTDTVHMLPEVDGAQLGAATMTDFRIICDVVRDMAAAEGSPVGGIWYNIGSAVVLPEVFLKAVAVARNLGADLEAMHTANFDMIRHYRPGQNVVTRPVAPGHGHQIVGQHEILLPLLRQALIEELS
jgi:hypothetical protein